MTRKRLVLILSAGLAVAAFVAGAAARYATQDGEDRRVNDAPDRPAPSASLETRHV